ncbi:hypothetical protein LINPERPRIM_LOCUS41381 [Linum perenne]
MNKSTSSVGKIPKVIRDSTITSRVIRETLTEERGTIKAIKKNRNQLGSTSTNLPPPGFPAPQQKSNIELLLERLVADNQKRDNSVQSLEKQMLTMQQVLLQQAKGKGTMPSMPIQNPKRDENLGAIVTRSGYSGRT